MFKSPRTASTLTLTTLLSLSISLSSLTPAMAVEPGTVQSAETATPEPPFNLKSDAVSAAISRYKASPDETTWSGFLKKFQTYLSDPRVAKSLASNIIVNNPSLKDIGVKAFDAGGSRVWYFASPQHSDSLLVQTTGVSTVKYPQTVNITDAQVVKSTTVTVKTVKHGRRTIQQKVKTQGPSFLVLAGNDRNSGLLWLTAYKPTPEGWVQTSEPFAKLPPHFLDRVSGRATFAGANIVLSLSSSKPSENGKPRPKSTTYQLTLVLNGGAYQLSDHPPAEGPVTVISYFLKCIKEGRLDLAKAWLKDERLVNIPRYAGVLNDQTQPCKVISMSTPRPGTSRFRLVTYKDHDLIFDVTKEAQKWIIRGIFIAPADPLARELSGTLLGQALPDAVPASIKPAQKPPVSIGQKQSQNGSPL